MSYMLDVREITLTQNRHIGFHRYLCERFDRVIGIDINTNAVNVLATHGYKVVC